MNFVVVNILYVGARERAQQLQVHAALAEGVGSIPNTHLTQLELQLQGDLIPLTSEDICLHMHMRVHTYMLVQFKIITANLKKIGSGSCFQISC